MTNSQPTAEEALVWARRFSAADDPLFGDSKASIYLRILLAEYDRLIGKLRTIEILTNGSQEVAGLHYLAESALEGDT